MERLLKPFETVYTPLQLVNRTNFHISAILAEAA